VSPLRHAAVVYSEVVSSPNTSDGRTPVCSGMSLVRIRPMVRCGVFEALSSPNTSDGGMPVCSGIEILSECFPEKSGCLGLLSLYLLYKVITNLIALL
jgi:hypothetical protein